MGGMISSKVEKTLLSSPDFNSSCQQIYNNCLSESQHAFSGVKPYQLPGAVASLHASLALSSPLVRRWLQSPPPREMIDAAIGSRGGVLSLPEFEAFAVELFRDAIVAGAGGAAARAVEIGAVGIAGVGIVGRKGVGIVMKAVGIYSAGVAAAVFFSLG